MVAGEGWTKAIQIFKLQDTLGASVEHAIDPKEQTTTYKSAGGLFSRILLCFLVHYPSCFGNFFKAKDDSLDHCGNCRKDRNLAEVAQEQ